MSEQDIRAERIRKLALLDAYGMPAYPAQVTQSFTIKGVLERYEHHVASQESITISGRIVGNRGQGGIMFFDMNDGSAQMQAVLQATEMDEKLFQLAQDAAERGDFIETSGTAYLTKRGEKSLLVKRWRMLSKSLLPIPDAWFGLQDEELKLRERYVSILLNPEIRVMFERKAKFWQTVRTFYIDRGFLEVEIPVFESTPGGADARPFTTHHNSLDIDVSLRISLELPLKKLLVAGYPKVFEVGRIFRNEGQSREHLQDYTQIESYEAFRDMRYGMMFVQDLYRTLVKEVYGRYTFEINGHTVDFAEEWMELNFCEVIKEKFGIDPLTCTEAQAIQAVRDARIQVGEALNTARAVDHLWKSIRKSVTGPVFLTGVPAYMEPLAKRSENDPRIVERFQVVLAGSEMGKGFSELNDPLDQRTRFEEQQKLRDAGDDEAQRLDEEYVRAMEYGMPPSFGFGMSERLFSFLENRPAHEAQLFPLLRPLNTKSKSKDSMLATIVLNTQALDASWKELNTTAHLAASFAAREGKHLFMKDSVRTNDGFDIPLNIRHAIMIRTAQSGNDITEVWQAAKKLGLTAVPFTKEMLETTNDKKVAEQTAGKSSAEVVYLGVLVFGARKEVDALTSVYPLHS